ncbi:MAG: hypothetical protein ABS81_05470 [Pseudonocardia sp. SCN 72-86]|nr:MAG: hypothetical protein ABS81_05470 [Pseudonocardia sp. SCN 72-86]
MGLEHAVSSGWVFDEDLVFRQYYLGCLSQASYVIADRGTRRAVVVDPQRDVAQYVLDAGIAGLRIERVIETHVNADFVSGHLEVAAVTGAAISFSDAAAVEFPVEFPVEPLADNEILSLGSVTLEIRHAPGHTPESLCIVVCKSPLAAPWAVLTGDTLLIDNLGRPEVVDDTGWSTEGLACALYGSIRQRLLTLPDATRVFPAHGEGWVHGGNLLKGASSTIGEQRRANSGLAAMHEHEFVAAITEAANVVPWYSAHVANRNRRNRAVLEESASVRVMSWPEIDAAMVHGAIVLDTRGPHDFAAGHLEGSVNVSVGGRFAEMVAQVVCADADIMLIVDGSAAEVRNRLARIGFDRVMGVADGLGSVPSDRMRSTTRLNIAQLAALADVRLVDVGEPYEIEASGLVPNAVSLPLAALVTRIGELDPAVPTVVYCTGGHRSSTAASVMRACGFSLVHDVIGGVEAWSSCEGPVQRAAPV